jgi:hypothetical protein
MKGKRTRGFLKRIRLMGVAAVNDPAHDHDGWLVMKATGPSDGVVVGVWDEHHEALLDDSLEQLQKSTAIDRPDDIESAVEKALTGDTVRLV